MSTSTRLGFEDLSWSRPPPQWTLTDAALTAEAAAGTDFWSRTHYGFIRHDGHLLAADVTGDFVLTARVAAEPVHQYDQAGLMVRLSETCWMKTSIEHEPDHADRLGVVVTNAGFSDWSTQATALSAVRLRVERRGLDHLVSWTDDEDDWTQLRMFRLLDDDGLTPVQAGLYLCSPVAAGMRARFTDFALDLIL
jgi:hypothetical protein